MGILSFNTFELVALANHQTPYIPTPWTKAIDPPSLRFTYTVVVVSLLWAKVVCVNSSSMYLICDLVALL